MKKILLLLLCVAFCATMLASCGDGEIGDFEYPGYVPEDIPNITLDFHIIVGEGTGEIALDSVARMLSQYTETKFKTKLNVHYILESEYEETLKADIKKSGDAKADIVLINSPKLMDDLVKAKSLYDLTEFYNGKKFGRLNTIITDSLIDASLINGKYYSVPNDHIVGKYTYLIINEDVATNGYNISPDKLKACTSLEDEVIVDFKAALEADGKNFSDYVKLVDGDQNDKVAYEAEGYICNVAVYPQVDDNEVFSAAFGIVNGIQYPERAMEVIYLLSTDTYFRNLLQYGVEGVNYVKDDDGNIVPHSTGDGVYNMNMLHTGSSFLLYYSDSWTEEMKNVGLAQNKDSVVYVVPAEPAPVEPAPEEEQN